MPKKIAIIGAGIAGLSAGCFLQMNGYDTEIFESYILTGGLCTAWKRDGYVFENAIHWLTGAKPGDSFYASWNALVDMKGLEFFHPEAYMVVEFVDGKSVTLYADADRLEREMLRVAPEDENLIREFVGAVIKFTRFKIPMEKPPDISGLLDQISLLIKVLPFYKEYKKWSSISIRDYARKYKNPFLRKAIGISLQSERSALALVLMFAWTHSRNAAYPVGGSMKLANLVEQRYRQLGGEIHFRSRVKKVVVENDTARGIVLHSGKTHHADVVVSAADGHFTIFELLEGRYVDEGIRDLYDNCAVMPSYVQVYLGVARSFEGEPDTLTLELETPLIVDPETEHEYVAFRIHNQDPTLAPAGETVITTMLKTSNYQYWVDLRKENRKKYKLEKEKIANTVIEALDGKYGNIKATIETVDVSTPATVIRYTNNWQGSHQGWITTPEMGFRQFKKALPGLKNFYMVGHWAEQAGGLPTAVVSGRHVAQIICAKDGKRFVAIEF